MPASGAETMLVLTCTDQSQIQFQLTPGVPCSGFREMGVYQFTALPIGASLYIDEALVEAVDTPAGPQLHWQPGFYAGEVSAEVLDATGARLAAYRIDVGPDESKLGAELFQSMLDEIHIFDPALLLGTEAAQSSIGVTGDVTTLLLQYARLRRHADDLIRSLQSVAARPLSRLLHERKRVPLQRIRRLDSTSARRLMRHPGAGAVLRRSLTAEAGTPALDVMHSFEDLDNAANRALAATLAAVRQRCSSVAGGLVRLAAARQDEGSRTPLAQRLDRKLLFLDNLSSHLRRLAQIPPFSTASRTEVTAAGLTAISAQPAYARAYRLGWASLRPGVAGPERDESLWLSPTWEIYERWCFIRVAESLRTLFPQLDWTCRRYPKVDVIRYTGKSEGVVVEASLQRMFRFANRSTAGLRSVSLQLRPDIVVTANIGGNRRMLVLDAKYRTARRHVLDSMRSAHLYQDALRWDGRRPDCSLLLVPRGGGAPWLEDEAFHRNHRTGVHVLAPGQPVSELRSLLDHWLGSHQEHQQT